MSIADNHPSGWKVDKTLFSMGQNIFLIAIKDELRASAEDAEQELDSILTNTGIGRLTTDPYELREAHKMLRQKSQPTNSFLRPFLFFLKKGQ